MAEPKHRLLPDSPYPSYGAYLSSVGWSAAVKARAQTPAGILDAICKSGLRGRGGAGFSTGVKWTSVFRHPCTTRYVVVNAAEGEPGTFKDRALLRKNPYDVIEGLLVAAHVIGARSGYIALKKSFTREIARVKRAIDEMEAAGVIGSFPIVVVEGPEEYLYGEEKALLSVIEGEGPLPRSPDNPPYEVGLFATPTSPNPALVNNAETLAHVATIVRHGADSFRRLGTHDTSGTILATLSGDIARPGVYEIEAGLPLRALLEQQGGGARPGRTIKAVLSGVSTAPLVASKLDTAVDFGSLQLAGSGLGSAGFIVIDDATSMPRVAQAVARFLYVESCNQCSACKAGLRIASRAIDELFDLKMATPDDPERALFGAASAPQGNRCYLPVQASVLIPSLVHRFKPEFDAQVADPGRADRAWLIPKMIDFDEAAGQFLYDEKQPSKQPDWTYSEPHDRAPPPRSEPPPSAGLEKKKHRRPTPFWPAPRGPLSVRLAPDLTAQLHLLAEATGIELDRQVDQALREWLSGRTDKSKR